MSIKLLLDLGNTRLKIWRVKCAKGGDVEWLERAALDTSEASGQVGRLPLDGVDEVLLSAVGRMDWRQQLAAAVNRRGIAFRDVVVAGEAVTHCYERPELLGVDRWLGLLAARRYVSGAALVVDAGTAVTLDVLDAHGAHLGGLIVPGLSTMRRSLHEGTASLPAVEGGSAALGTSTEAAIAAGTLRSIAHLVESVYEEYADKLGALSVVIAGGDGEAVYNALSLPARLEVDWVAKGMLEAVSVSESQ